MTLIVLAKPTGGACNLACSYCFYRGHPGGRMSHEIARALCERARAVIWQGGEPTLMGVEFYRRLPRGPAHSIQTNGTLIDDEWAAFFSGNGWYVGLSVDGPRALHDRARRAHDGARTHASVLRAARLLRRYGVQFVAVATIDEHNASEPEAVYDALAELEPEALQFIPAGVSGDAHRDFMLAVLRRWELRGRKPRVREIEYGCCVNSTTCGDYVVVEHDGSVYSCDHYVEPDHKLGNVIDTPLVRLLRGEKQRAFGLRKTPTDSACSTCAVLSRCNGGCPKDRDASGRNRFCSGYAGLYGSQTVPKNPS